MAQDEEQLAQNRFVLAEQMPVKYWLEEQAEEVMQGTHEGVFWPLHDPESV